MRLRVRAVRLRVLTSQGGWGRMVTFQPGFNVLRGSNSRGKTQVVQALIYALGLERMLQARANAPLGSALTSELRVDAADDSAALAVERSWVAVELENDAGRVLTSQRQVRHNRIDRDLARVWEGPALTDPAVLTTCAPLEMFLHRAGSATRGLGFHKLLADMVGWELPTVATYTGTTTTLYPDVVFPFLIVDQQSWGSAAPRKVERYQIREPLRRSAEFLLGLAGPQAEARRAELERSMATLRTRWAAARSSVETLARAVGGRVTGVPEHAAGAQARATMPEPSSLNNAQLEILDSEEWIAVTDVVAAVSSQLLAVEEAGVRQLAPGRDPRASQDLEQSRSGLGELLAAAQLLENDLSLEEAQLAALDRRLIMLEEERDRNFDIRTLVRLGSEVAATHLADHNCPTCRQSLEAVETDGLGPVLNVDETVSLLNAQISTARKMRDRSQRAVTQSSSAYAAMQRQADQVRATVRALEEDLLAPANTPSAGDIALRITLQLRLDELRRAQDAIADQLDELTQIANEIATTRENLSALPAGVPDADTTRLDELTTSVRTRLSAMRFGSYDINDVSLDQDSLRPTRAGFDMDTDVSASDVVRIKVAYLDAVRVHGQTGGRHPGLLVLDEPRQQDIDPADYGAMLRILANSNSDGGQVIVTSAAPVGELGELLSVLGASVTDVGEQRLLQQEEDTDPMDLA